MTGGEAYKQKLLTDDALDVATSAHLVDPSKPVGSSSAIAKYADALRGISLAWRSSRTSRSRALIR